MDGEPIVPYAIIVLGTAGSGKTTLTAALADFLLDNELDVVTVNLDPAVETLPYKPDIDTYLPVPGWSEPQDPFGYSKS